MKQCPNCSVHAISDRCWNCNTKIGDTLSIYKPMEIELLELSGVKSAMRALRLPKNQIKETYDFPENSKLAGKLIKAGDDHAKAIRGVIAWCEIKCQVGWLLEYEQYEVGVTRMSSSSSMHNELKTLNGKELAEKKQVDLSTKQYTIIDCISYQTLRRIYKARRNHRHPDWHRFCDWVETLPYFKLLIIPE